MSNAVNDRAVAATDTGSRRDHRPPRASREKTLSSAPWWTAADAAELDLLTVELVRVAFLHRDGCDHCQARTGWCDRMRDAFTGLQEWLTSRELQSRAQWLRTAQEQAPGSVAAESSAYGRTMLGRLSAGMASTDEGEQKTTLNRVAWAAGLLVADGHLSADDCEHALLDAAATAGLPASEAQRTFRSGFDAGRTREGAAR